MQELALIREARNVTVGVEDGVDGAVRLSSIHQAKGLEWPLVVLIGLADERFPGVRARTDDALEEERRIFHVGVTRAHRELCLTWPARVRDERGLLRWSRRSRFLDELVQSREASGQPLVELVRTVVEEDEDVRGEEEEGASMRETRED